MKRRNGGGVNALTPVRTTSREMIFFMKTSRVCSILDIGVKTGVVGEDRGAGFDKMKFSFDRNFDAMI